jgi:hypothetical protein
MPITRTAARIRYAGRDLRPGDSFTPFPEVTGYRVTFNGIITIDDIPHVVLTDPWRTLTRPLTDIPHDTDGPRPYGNPVAYTLFTRTDTPEH